MHNAYYGRCVTLARGRGARSGAGCSHRLQTGEAAVVFDRMVSIESKKWAGEFRGLSTSFTRRTGPEPRDGEAMVVEIAASLAGRKTAHEYVKDSLRQAILRGTIPGGSRLVQADIARDLQVSTTPVREALRDLATEGLIRLDPHRGAIVHRLSYEETREVHDICKMLEPEAMRKAAKVITEETLAEADALAQQMVEESDTGRWADLNRQFHGVVIRDIDSKYLLDILRTLRDTAAMYVGLAISHRPIQMQEANREHGEILDVLRRRDAGAAAKISRRHLDLTLRTLEASRHLLEH